MIKLNVFNMNAFLKVVNDCTGPVYLLADDGKKVNLHRNEFIQLDLRSKHIANKRSISLSLDAPQTKDYMNLVFFSIGDY